MKFVKSKLIALGLLAAVQMNAKASLLHPQEYESGGLTWLTLSETVGLSIFDYMNGVGGWNTKYRLARDNEVNALLQSFDITPLKLSSSYKGNLGSFWRNVGGYIEGNSYDGTWFHDGSQGARGMSATIYVDLGVLTGDGAHGDTPTCQQTFDCGYVEIERRLVPMFYKSPTVGLFLVEGAQLPPSGRVPEPSSLALFGAVGLAAWARRRKGR